MKTKIPEYIGWVSIIMAVMLMAAFAFYSLVSPTHWIEYDRIESTKEVYSLNESPTLISYNVVRRDAVVSFRDNLRCKLNSSEFGFGSYADDIVSNVSVTVKVKDDRGNFPPAPWVFNNPTPLTEPAECFIRANIVLHFPFGIDRTQVIDSEHFRFENI